MRAVVLISCLAGCASQATPAPARAPVANVPGPEPAAPASQHTSCNDPIAGTWRARVWRPEVGKVDEVTLTLARVGMTELRGQIDVATWDADNSSDEPPTCPDGSTGLTRVVQNASGWIHGAEVDIVGSDPERTVLACGITSGTYNPDHFTGELDNGSTLVTTNDDGGIDQGRPHVFTRTACAR